MNYLELGAKTLHSRLQQYAGVSVTYQRKGAAALTLTPVPGRVMNDTEDLNGAVLKETTRDFIFDRKDFAPLSTPKPLRGDMITHNGEVFSVGGEDLGSPPYEEADSYGVAWRVHTKRVVNA